MLDLNDLYFFVKVIDEKGFDAASRALDVPKSSLSNRVARLQTQLGVRLIQRNSRRFTVTDIGHEFYQHAAGMLIEADAAQNVVNPASPSRAAPCDSPVQSAWPTDSPSCCRASC